MKTPLLAAVIALAPLCRALAGPDDFGVPIDNVLLGRLGVCMHLPGGFTEMQLGALAPLGITRIRVDVFYANPAAPELLKLKGGNYDVLGIMIPEHDEEGRALFAKFEEDPEAFIDRYVKALPWIKHWEFSNETDNVDFTNIPAEQYVGHLKKAYDVFQRKYPQLTLVSASPRGNNDGAKYLTRMIKAGLLSMPNLVIGVHVYEAKAEKFKQMDGRRVWVTESGATWNNQVKHWDGQIRDIHRVLKPERIYWYAHWENKQPGDGDGWISIAADRKTVTTSPLYKRLAISALGIPAAP